jgi:hypothetical protein
MDEPGDYVDNTKTSECCGAACLGECVEGWGICQSCKEHAFFEDRSDEDLTHANKVEPQ